MIKSTTAVGCQQRMNRVSHDPCNHLDDDIRIDDLAEVAPAELPTQMCLPLKPEMEK